MQKCVSKTYNIMVFFCVKEHSNKKKSPSASPNPHQSIVYNYIFFFQGLLFSLRNFLYSAGPISGGKRRAGTRKSSSGADGLMNHDQERYRYCIILSQRTQYNRFRCLWTIKVHRAERLFSTSWGVSQTRIPHPPVDV